MSSTQHINNKITSVIAFSAFALTSLGTSAVHAGVLTGGTFNLTYDSPANLLNGMTTGPGTITEWRVAGFFPKTVADTSTTTSMTGTPDFAAPSTLVFDVNPANLTGTGIPTGNSPSGRNNQVTTLSWDSSQDSLTNSSTFVTSGQVGLDGVVLTRGSFTGSLLYGDFDFRYQASRNNGINSGWTVTNHVSFGSSSYDTRNINVSTNGNQLTMTGDLWLSPNTGSFLLKTDGIINPGKIGTFSLTSPVPVPGAVWLFGSGLLGLLGARRKIASEP